MSIKKFLLLILLSGALSHNYAQWANNSEQNTRLVYNTSNPVNITSIEDNKGGGFIFWEDDKGGKKNIYFFHFDADGQASFRTDGKKIAEKSSTTSNPFPFSGSPNEVYVLYKDFTGSKNGNVFIQKVNSRGEILFNEEGIKLTNYNSELKEFSGTNSSKGNAFVAYIADEDSGDGIYVSKISSSGKKLFQDKKIILPSYNNHKINLSVIADKDDGAFILWLETIKSKSILSIIKVDADGNSKWQKPLLISSANSNALTYNASLIESGKIYTVWQAANKDKDIVHQLVDPAGNGKLLWSENKAITALPGNQINQQILASDSGLIVVWTNEIKGKRDVFVQMFNLKGTPAWSNEGLKLDEGGGEQYNPKVLNDGRSGAIISWIDKKADSLKADIYLQRINRNGDFLWKQDGVAGASNKNSEKSYISMISDERGGVILIFKEKRSKGNEILAQKIFNTGTFTSQIINFNVALENDSIKINWQALNEDEGTYEIERTVREVGANSAWKVIGSIKSKEKNLASYDFTDTPEGSGSIYYRVVHRDKKGNISPSNMQAVTYFAGATGIMVGQNVPNPFKESTKITFFLPTQSRVKIEFFNSQVEKLDEIEDVFNSGENTVEFKKAGLVPGIYFYRFKSGSFTEVKKMVVN